MSDATDLSLGRSPEQAAFLAGLPEDRRRAVLHYERLTENGGPNPRIAAAAETLLAARADDLMPEAKRLEAQKRLFDFVQAATREGNDQVQVYADRIWGRLNPDERLQLATNSTMAPSIIMDAMRNDHVLAPRIVVQIDQAQVRTIDQYQGSVAAGVIGGQFASLRAQDDARATEARQYADLRLSSSGVAALSSIGMDRTLFDRYLRDGFTQAQIISGARDANVLGFRGREDIDIAMNAPPELRAAAVAIMRAQTPEEKEAARRHYQEVKERLQQQYPPGDPHRGHIDNFDNRFQKVNGAFLDHAARNGVETTLAMSQEERVEANRRAIGGQEFDRVRIAVAERNEKAVATLSVREHGDVTLADFGLDPTTPRQAAAQPAATPDTKIAAGQATPGEGTTPDPAARTKTARAMTVKPPGGLA